MRVRLGNQRCTRSTTAREVMPAGLSRTSSPSMLETNMDASVRGSFLVKNQAVSVSILTTRKLLRRLSILSYTCEESATCGLRLTALALHRSLNKSEAFTPTPHAGL